MRWLLIFATVTAAFGQAPMWTLDRLYTRPFVWGTRPDKIAWAKHAPVAGFLWNEQGNRFLDLYAVDARNGIPTRLTRLETLKDDFWLTAEQKDSRRKNYVMPEPGLSSFALSADGRQAAFIYKGDLFTVPTNGMTAPFRRTRTKAPESSPQFSPDAKKLATMRGGQLTVLDLENGQLWQVTDFAAAAEGSISGYTWSPDGKRFAVLTRKGATRQLPLPNYSGQYVEAQSFARSVAADDSPEFVVYVIPAEGGKPVAMKPPTPGKKTADGMPLWSPDSRKLAWSVESANHKTSQILIYDASTGDFSTANEDTDERWVESPAVDWSPDSQRLMFTSERDGFAHLYTALPDGKDRKQLTSGKWEIRGEVTGFTCPEAHWREDGWIYFNSTEESTAQRHFYRVNPSTSVKEKLSTGPGLHCGLASEDGSHRAVMQATLAQPLDLWVDGKRVTTSSQPAFASIPWPKQEFVSFPSRGDKATVKAKLMLPPGYDPQSRGAKQWPCVFYIHGAGIATSVLEQWGSYNELRSVFNSWLASQGYVVMDLDYRGSTGYGRDWRSGVYLHMGGKDLDDVLGGIDYMASLGNVDMKRIGIWGVSYGGFMTDMAMFQSPATFRAGVGWAAVNDWENYNAGYTQQRLNTPKSNPEAYRRSAPINFSIGLKNPLLIIHGMVDSNVLFQDAVQLTEKLIQEGKTFEHFYYPQEDHGFVRDETLQDAFRRTGEFLERHLK
ncbi:MAG: S9 family peptidase [Acidobacteriota bacterium]